MTDYYPLLARAVEGLEKNTAEARRSLYEQARNALVAQLRGINPPLNEPEITRERLALEEAVRKIEADAARQSRSRQPSGPSPAAPPPRNGGSDPIAPDLRSKPPSSRSDFDRDRERERERASARARSPDPRAADMRPSEASSRPFSPSQPPFPSSRERPARRPFPERPTADGAGMRGLRDLVSDTEALGPASAEAARSARENYGAVDAGAGESRARREPGEDIAAAGLQGQPPAGAEPSGPGAPSPRTRASGAEAPGESPKRPRGPMPRRLPPAPDERPSNPARRGLIAAVLALVIIAGMAGAAYWQRERISALFGIGQQQTAQGPRDQSKAKPKNEERVGQEGEAKPEQQQAPETPGPAIAQRVVLYEEEPGNAEGNRYVGSALWRTETISPGPGLSPELAIRADIEVPERRLAVTMSIRRNTDPALPASHTVEIMFNLPTDFAFGGVANVPGLLMKESEQTRGAPLSGLAVKVTNGFFLIGLSAAEADVQRNLQLLKDRAWFDIPIVYQNGRRAILAVEKGNPGDRAFKEAFATWRR